MALTTAEGADCTEANGASAKLWRLTGKPHVRSAVLSAQLLRFLHHSPQSPPAHLHNRLLLPERAPTHRITLSVYQIQPSFSLISLTCSLPSTLSQTSFSLPPFLPPSPTHLLALSSILFSSRTAANSFIMLSTSRLWTRGRKEIWQEGAGEENWGGGLEVMPIETESVEDWNGRV